MVEIGASERLDSGTLRPPFPLVVPEISCPGTTFVTVVVVTGTPSVSVVVDVVFTMLVNSKSVFQKEPEPLTVVIPVK